MSWIGVFSQLLALVTALLLAPLLTGWVNQCRAWLQNKSAPGVLQPYRTLHKLFNKESVMAEHASPLYRTAPYLIFSCMALACAIVPTLSTDLLAKLQRSKVLEPVWMVGIDPNSDGLKRARDMGIKTTADGVDGLVPHMLADGVQIVFDATSAYVHADNSRKVNALGALMIDLTPAAIGPFCVPPVNLKEHVGKGEMNVNMVTCFLISWLMVMINCFFFSS